MNRRKFLVGSASLISSLALHRQGFGQDVSGFASNPTQAPVPGWLTIALDSPAHFVPANYTGLSYELAQLTDPDFFAASNRELVALFRLLSPCGVLRLGGNSSESCWLKDEPATTAPELPSVAGPVSEHWMPRQLFMIPPEAIEQLAGFLRATGWQLIYGLNFGHSSPGRLAREAEFVARRVGDRLLYFQIGNEPDFYAAPNNRTRPPDWGFADYLQEWTACAEAITQRVPGAKFGGPDVGADSKWIAQFIPAARAQAGFPPGGRQRTLLCGRSARRSPGDNRAFAADQSRRRPIRADHRPPGRAEQSGLPDDRGKFLLPGRQTRDERCSGVGAVGWRLHAHAGGGGLRGGESAWRQPQRVAGGARQPHAR
ncbi:MAG: hypothetical protein WDM96_12705 [Lacunisphaera sp.]